MLYYVILKKKAYYEDHKKTVFFKKAYYGALCAKMLEEANKGVSPWRHSARKLSLVPMTNKLIYHHLILHKLKVSMSTSSRNKVILLSNAPSE